MQTLPLVNPCSGGTDTDKSSLRQNPYRVNPCSRGTDSNIDQSPLGHNPYLVDECSGKIGRNNDLQFEHPKTISLSTNGGFLGHAKNINNISKKISSAGKKGTKAMDRASHKVVGDPQNVKKYAGRRLGSLVKGAANGASSLVKSLGGGSKK